MADNNTNTTPPVFDMIAAIPAPQYLEVRVAGKLMCKLDPDRLILQFVKGGETVYADIAFIIQEHNAGGSSG